jgi:hypothetical protein
MKGAAMSKIFSPERTNDLHALKEKYEDLLILGIDNPGGLHARAWMHESSDEEDE